MALGEESFISSSWKHKKGVKELLSRGFSEPKEFNTD